jgi:uncharacterized membrane protein YoaK (UPF0700 family)
MQKELVDAWHLIAPPKDGAHGPLPPALVLLTVVTGLVDAFSYLRLGHVFVANMTGNVVFLPFALGGAAGFAWWTSVLAIAAFSLGALTGGRIARAAGAHRGRHLLAATATQTAIVAAAFVVATAAPSPYPTAATVAMIAMLGAGMGVQNATARALAIPDLTTTVLTLTITGISADSATAGGPGSHAGRRLTSIASMFLGALIGTLLIESGHAPWTLLVATALLAATAALTGTTARSTAPWTTRR